MKTMLVDGYNIKIDDGDALRVAAYEWHLSKVNGRVYRMCGARRLYLSGFLMGSHSTYRCNNIDLTDYTRRNLRRPISKVLKREYNRRAREKFKERTVEAMRWVNEWKKSQ